jgi:hypothetical protein
MESEVANADYVLIVCTPAYARKAVARNGGVGYEQQIVSGRLVSGIPRSSFIPVIRAGEYELGEKCAIPENFLGIVALDFRDDEKFFESFETLLRVLFSTPEFTPPPIGTPPDFPASLERVPAPISSEKDTGSGWSLPKGGNRVLSVAGKELNRRTVAVLTVGILSAIALFASTMPMMPTREVSPSVPPRHLVPPTPADKKKFVHDFTDPTYEAFELLSDRRTLDMRDWRDVPQDKMSEPISPVTLTREIKARKKVDVNAIRFQFSTSSLDMNFVCDTQNYTVEEKAPGPTGGKVGIQKTYQVVVDLSKVGVGEEFTVLIEATYWNAFQPPDGTFMTMRMHAPVGLISMTLISPEKRKFVDYRLADIKVSDIAAGSKAQPEWDRGKGVFLIDKNREVIYWEVPNPEVGHAYKINWNS